MACRSVNHPQQSDLQSRPFQFKIKGGHKLSAVADPLIGCFDLIVAVPAPEHLPAARRHELAAPPVVLAAVLEQASALLLLQASRMWVSPAGGEMPNAIYVLDEVRHEL